MDSYTKAEGRILLDLIDKAIQFGLKTNKLLQLRLSDYTEKLQKKGASFITLELQGQLRGCIGTLRAYQPLVQDIAQNSYYAAFKDTRFSPLTSDEYGKLRKTLSILSVPTRIEFTSEEDLIKKLQPGLDGLILSDKGHEGTFLPSVWQELPEAKLFLEQLKLKAGFKKNYWSKTLIVARYRVKVIE
jgi:hypothetical protein